MTGGFHPATFARVWEAEVGDPLPDRCPRAGILIIGLGAAALVFGLGLWLFPRSSPISDERVYVQEALSIEAGHLTLPAAFHPDHDPFFTYPNDRGELMFKYPPAWPAVLALADLATGTTRSAIAVVALALVTGVGAFAWELTRRRRVSLLSAALVAACPLVLVLGATRLAYGFSAALLVWASTLIVRAARTRGAVPAVAAGALGGLAFFARPFDAVLFLAPVVVWAAWDRRVGGVGLVRLGALAAVGAAPPLGLLLWTDRRITGSAFTMPYMAVGPHDLPGFGPRLDVHAGRPFDFTFAKGLSTLGRGLWSSLAWMPLSVVGGAILLIGLSTVRRRTAFLLAALSAVIPLGYVFFWGAWNGYERLGTTQLVGPMYYVPAVIPVVVLGAAALARLPRPAALALAVVGLGSGALLVRSSIGRLEDFRTRFDDGATTISSLERAAKPEGVLLIEQADSLRDGVPIYNDVHLSGPVVAATDRPGRAAQLLQRFPDRASFRFEHRYVLAGRPGTTTDVDGLGLHRQSVITRLRLHSAPRLDAEGALPGAGTAGERIVVEMGPHAWSWPAVPSQELGWDGRAATMDGALGRGDDTLAMTRPPAGILCVGRLGASSGSPRSARYDQICFDVGVSDGQVAIVTPGRGATRFGPTPTMLAADVGDRLQVTWPT